MQGQRREVFVLFTLQKSQNDLRKTSKNNVKKVRLIFIDRIKTLKINDLNKKVAHKKLMAWNKISKVTSKKTLTRLFNHSSLCQVIQKGNFMFVMVSFFGNASKASFQLECCLEFHQITALFLPFYLSIYLSIYLYIYFTLYFTIDKLMEKACLEIFVFSN